MLGLAVQSIFFRLNRYHQKLFHNYLLISCVRSRDGFPRGRGGGGRFKTFKRIENSLAILCKLGSNRLVSSISNWLTKNNRGSFSGNFFKNSFNFKPGPSAILDSSPFQEDGLDGFNATKRN